MCVCGYLCAHVEARSQLLVLFLDGIHLGPGSLTRPEILSLDWAVRPGETSVSTLSVLELDAHNTVPNFLHGFWGSNLVLVFALASSLPTELSPLPFLVMSFIGQPRPGCLDQAKCWDYKHVLLCLAPVNLQFLWLLGPWDWWRWLEDTGQKGAVLRVLPQLPFVVDLPRCCVMMCGFRLPGRAVCWVLPVVCSPFCLREHHFPVLPGQG